MYNAISVSTAKLTPGSKGVIYNDALPTTCTYADITLVRTWRYCLRPETFADCHQVHILSALDSNLTKHDVRISYSTGN